jgi:hypothetical protein
LLLIGSSHAHWTHHALLRCKISEFFSSLLERGRRSKISWQRGRTRVYFGLNGSHRPNEFGRKQRAHHLIHVTSFEDNMEPASGC